MASLSLESISKQIEDISWRKEDLRKSFEQLQPHSSALSFSLQWQEIEHYFDSIKKSIDDSFRDLESKASRQQQQTKSTAQSQSQIDESIPHPESKSHQLPLSIGNLESKSQQQLQNKSTLQSHIDESIRNLESKHQKDESFSDLESKEARQKVFKLGLFKFQPQTIPEKRTPEKRQRPEPGSDGLRYLITKSSSSLSTMYDKVAEKLRSSANPAKMAFDVIEGLGFCFYEGQWLVLEVLMKVASEMEITVEEVERKRALELAGRWKKIMRDINFICMVLPEAFLKFVKAFELISDVGVDGLFVAFSRFENKERIRLFREFGLEEKAPVLIRRYKRRRKKKEKEDSEDLNFMSNNPDHPVDLVVMAISEEPYGLPVDKSILSVVSQDDLTVAVHHIDFIFGDEPWIVKVCDKMVQIQQLGHLMVQWHIHAKCDHRNFIQQLIGENKHMVALEFVFAFKLGDKFPPSALLEEYLKEAKQQAQEMRRSGNGNPHEAYSATMTELTAMDLVMRYIKDNNIKAESLRKSVVESISKLQKQAQKEHIAAKAAPKPQKRKKLKKTAAIACREYQTTTTAYRPVH